MLYDKIGGIRKRLQSNECILLLCKSRVSGELIRSQYLRGNECKQLLKSLLSN